MNNNNFIPNNEEVSTVAPELTPAKLVGVVTDCKKLNVREKAYLGAEVLCVLSEGTEVEIDETKSTDTFYSLCTVEGVEGFAMKQYITVDQ